MSVQRSGQRLEPDYANYLQKAACGEYDNVVGKSSAEQEEPLSIIDFPPAPSPL